MSSFISRDANGYKLLGVFDVNPDLIGKEMCGVPILPLSELEAFCTEHHPEVAVLCVPRQSAMDLAGELVGQGIKGFWNFSHYDLSVEVAGIPRSDVRAGLLPKLEICGVAPCTDFENRVCGEATDYTLETRYDADKMLLTSETNIMRHTNHEAVSVCLRTASGESTFVEVNLAEFLAEHPAIDCSKQEVLIPIRIEFTSAGVEVSVPDWFVQEVKPEF